MSFEQEVSRSASASSVAPRDDRTAEDASGHDVLSASLAGRDAVRRRVVAAGERELGEVDAAFEKEKAELERRLGETLGTVTAEERAQAGAIDAKIAGADAAAASVIAGRSAMHDEEIAGARVSGESTVSGADELRTAAAAQAVETRALAKKKADETRAAGKTQAARARATGASKANEATIAAAAAGGKVQPDELGTIAVAGAARASQAAAEAERLAVAIEAEAEAEAKAILADGEKKAEAQIARGEAAAAEARTRAAAGAARVADRAAFANGVMELEARAAAERMGLERRDLGLETEGQRAAIAGAANRADAAAQARADQDRAEALARMQKAHDDERKKVEARVQATLARVDRARDADLAWLSRQVSADLAALDRESEAAERAMAGQVDRSDEKLERALASVKLGLRASGRKAAAAIDRFGAEARRRILAADRGTSADLALAARHGREAVTEELAAVAKEDAGAEGKAEASLEALAKNDRGALDNEAATDELAMTHEADAVGGAIDAGWVRDAVIAADRDLDDEGVFNIVTDGEAIDAMDLLISLPAGVQAKAVAGLGAEQFANLLGEVPKARREELEPLVKNTSDPERKLLLWREFYKSHGWNDAARLAGDVGDAENQRRDERRRAAADDAEGEADEEAKFLLAKGSALAASDVDALIERKAIEHDLEMKYNVDITNDARARADGSKVVWSAAELKALEASFAQIPAEHMAGNKLLRELHRSESDVAADGTPVPTVGGQHSNGVVTVFDSGAQLGASGYRHGGDARELASPYVCGRCGATINVIDMVVTHEIGHDMHDQKGDVFEKYQKASGWEKHGKADLESAGLTAAEIRKLESTRGQNYALRNQIHKNGKIYMVDPYAGGYLCVDETAIPDVGESEVGAGGSDFDTWEYARSNYKDQFAEHYAKAVHVPEMLYKDLVENPAREVDLKKVGLDVEKTTQRNLDPTRNTPHDYEAAAQAVAKSEKELAAAEKARDQRKQQFEIMRNEVFGADKEVAAAEARLRARGVAAAKIAAFRAEAEKVSTPQQVRLLEGRVT